jgi:glycosyltransferase involved in cell wall biosynthesis
MKIAMIDPSLFTLPYDLALCTALSAQGGEVTLYGRKMRPLEIITPEVLLRPLFYGCSERIRGKIPGTVFRFVKGVEHGADIAYLARLFRRMAPMVIHFQWLPLPVIDLAAVRHIRRFVGPTVLTVHDMAPFNNSPASMMQRIGWQRIWREFDHLIVHGEGGRSLLIERGVSSDRISTIAHGVLDVARAQVRNVPRDGRLVILLFGRIKSYKGVEVMIEALGRLPANLQAQCHVLIVGEPMISVDRLRNRAEMLRVADKVTWDLRYVSEAEMGTVFNQADVFAFPYREIDTSGVLMSCLQYGKPIIASDIGGFKELLRDGIHGRLIPPNRSDALADAIAGFLADRSSLQTYGHNVAQLTARISSWNSIAGLTMALYERLVAARAKPTSNNARGRTL